MSIEIKIKTAYLKSPQMYDPRIFPPFTRILITILLVYYQCPGLTATESRYDYPVGGFKEQVIGGEFADINEMPFMGAMVRNEEGDNSRQFCGCTAIDPYWVITTAHCVDEDFRIEDFKLVFGTGDLENIEAGIVMFPKTIIKHPDYAAFYNDKYADIALIQLSTPLPDWIAPVQLNKTVDLELPGQQAIIAGWGRTDLVNETDTTLLKAAQVRLRPLEESNLADYYKERIKGTMLAAGENNPYTTTYSGDSGGPLMVFDNESGSWIQIGITSFGASNKEEDPTTYFTRIATYADWIEKLVESDFHRWMGKWKLTSLESKDEDDYTTTMEWLLGLNPELTDGPKLSPLVKFRTKEASKELIFPLQLRDSISKFFVRLLRTTDFKVWSVIPFPNYDWDFEPLSEPGLSLYNVPLTGKFSIPGFYKLFLNEQVGIHHGPLPLRVGHSIQGHLAYAFNNTGIEPLGLTRHEFLLEHFSSEYPIGIYVKLEGMAEHTVDVLDFDNGNIIESAWYHETEISTLTKFQPQNGHRYLVRLDMLRGEPYVPFEIFVDYEANPTISVLGETISGSLAHDDIPYLRPGYYADRYTFEMPADRMYKISMMSETLDSAIITKRYIVQHYIEEIDEKPPGKPEEFLYHHNRNATIEVFAGSWRFEETGDYTLRLTPYEEPETVKPGDDFLAMTDTSDRKNQQGDTTFRLDYFDIIDFDVGKGITFKIDGIEDHPIAFAILDDTEEKSIYQSSTTTSSTVYYFEPVLNHEYRLMVISREQFLGRNFRIAAIEGDIMSQEGFAEENNPELDNNYSELDKFIMKKE